MSNSVLSNTALENKQLTPAQTRSKLTFAQNKITVSGLTSGTKCEIANVAEPTNSTSVATKNYVDESILSQNVGLSWKNPSDAVQTSAFPSTTYSSGTIEGFSNGALPSASIDGLTPEVGLRIVVNEMTTASQNGIYEIATVGDGTTKFALNRTVDADTASELQSATTAIKSGTVYGGSTYVESLVISTLDTDPVKFIQLSTGINETSVSDGLEKIGKYISIKVDNTRGIGITDDKVAIIDAGVTDTQLADDAVTAQKIADGAVLEGHIFAGSVTENAIGAGAVTNTRLGALSVTEDKLGLQAVESQNIKNQNILSAHIGADQLLSSHYQAGSVDQDAIGANEVKSSHIAGSQILQGHYSANSVNETALAPASVTETILAPNAVISNRIKAQNVTTDKLDQTVGTEAVTTDTIRDAQITLAKMATNSVDTSQIKNNAVDNTKLADNCILDRHISTLNNLTVNGEVSAASFNAGGVGGTTSMSLARIKFYNVDFGSNGAFAWTTTFQKLPHNDSVVSFSYEDAIIMSSTAVRMIIASDAVSNYAEVVVGARFWAAEGTMENDITVSAYQVANSVAGNSEQELTLPALVGNGDDRIAEISVWVRKSNAQGVLTCPANSDFFVNCLVVSENSSTIQKTYNNGTFS